MRRLTGDYPGSVRDLQEAVGISRDLGDLRGQARALAFLGHTWRLTGDYPAAVRDLQEALGISRKIGDSPGQVAALAYLGAVRRLTGDYQGQPGTCRRRWASPARSATGSGRPAPSYTWGTCGASPVRPEAVRDLQEALGISREIGSRLWQAEALTYLGAMRRLAGDYPGAARDLQEALGISRGIGNRDAELTALNESGTLSRTRDDLGQAWHLPPAGPGSGSPDRQRPAGGARSGGPGPVRPAAGRTAEAEERGCAKALAIFQRIGAAEAIGVSAELDALAAAPDPALTSP